MLPGGGSWPWWGWALYATLAGPLLLLALVPAAVLRLVLPGRRRVWGFRGRRAAARYLAVVALAVAAAAGIQSGALARGLALSLYPLWGAAGGGAAGAVEVPGGMPAPVRSPAAAGVPAEPPLATPPAAVRGTVTEVPAPTPTEATVSPTIAEESSDTPVPDGPAPIAVSSDAPVPVGPAPTAVPTAAPRVVVVGNTGGLGVALRRSPRWADRVPGVAWRDRTALAVLEEGIPGDDGAGGSAPWVRVRDPAGREGFVPARYVLPAG